MSATDVPNPGSAEARDGGCTCPVMDNARGRGWMCSGWFWINEDCPMHGPDSEWRQPVPVVDTQVGAPS